MKNLILLVLFLSKFSQTFGQDKVKLFKLDSLKQELAKAQTDTGRVLIYEKMIWVAPNGKPSVAYGQKGLALARRIHFDKGILICAYGTAFKMIEVDYYKAIPILMEAKALAEKIDDRYQLVRILSGLGYAYNKFDNGKALLFYEQCKRLMEKEKIPESVVPINTVIGYNYKDWGKLDAALIYLEKGYQYALKTNVPRINSFYVHFGEVYYKKGQPDLALAYFRRSVAALKTKPDGQSYLGIALIYRDRNLLDSAKFYAKEALGILQKTNRTIYTIRAASLLFDLYKTSSPAEALKYHLIATATKDSLFNQDKARQVEKLLYEDREREATIQRRVEAQQIAFENQIKIYSLFGVLILLGVATFIFYRSNQHKQRANLLLHDQKKEIDLQRKKAEQALKDLKATQNQLIQKEKMASLGELTAGIAHEIQNPLNFVNNFAEVSAEIAEELNESIIAGDTRSASALAVDLRQNMVHIAQNGQRASNIVRSMLEHSRTGHDENQYADLNAMADEYFKLAYHGVRSKDPDFNIRFMTDFDPALAQLKLVPQDMGRVMLNLYNNAFYAVRNKENENNDARSGSDYEPSVWVSTSHSDGWATLKVKDNGTGIAPEILNKIFQPFFTTKPAGQGTGLGLSLSYDIITKGHSGEMYVTSEPGHWTEFLILLPISQSR